MANRIMVANDLSGLGNLDLNYQLAEDAKRKADADRALAYYQHNNLSARDRSDADYRNNAFSHLSAGQQEQGRQFDAANALSLQMFNRQYGELTASQKAQVDFNHDQLLQQGSQFDKQLQLQRDELNSQTEIHPRDIFNLVMNGNGFSSLKPNDKATIYATQQSATRQAAATDADLEAAMKNYTTGTGSGTLVGDLDKGMDGLPKVHNSWFRGYEAEPYAKLATSQDPLPAALTPDDIKKVQMIRDYISNKRRAEFGTLQQGLGRDGGIVTYDRSTGRVSPNTGYEGMTAGGGNDVSDRMQQAISIARGLGMAVPAGWSNFVNTPTPAPATASTNSVVSGSPEVTMSLARDLKNGGFIRTR